MYSQMMAFLKEHQFDAVAESKKVTDRGGRALPFAWVFGRAHWTISLFGANVYVENVIHSPPPHPTSFSTFNLLLDRLWWDWREPR